MYYLICGTTHRHLVPNCISLPLLKLLVSDASEEFLMQKSAFGFVVGQPLYYFGVVNV